MKRTLPVAFLLSVLCITSVTAQDAVFGKTSTGTLTYPALDNMSFEECTVECWIKLAYDPAPFLPAKDYQGFLSFLSVKAENGGVAIGYAAQKGQDKPQWFCSVSPKPVVYGFGFTPALMKPGEWHHLAIVWKGPESMWYWDGKEVARSKQNAHFYQVFGSLRDATILFGDKWNRHALMVMDDLRVSRIARTPAELGFNGELKADVYTTLLDSFECDFTPDGKTPTKPSVIFNGAGGTATAPCTFVPGKFGKGLAFFKEGK